jgi:hypothetical protein
MKTGFKFVLSAAALSLAIGCGPDQDPSKNNGNGDPNGSTNGSPNGDTNGSPNGDTNGSPNGDTNGNPNGSTNGSTNGDPGPCEVNDVFFGQIDSDSDDHAGGAPTTDPLTVDAGLAAVEAEAAAVAEGMTAEVDLEVSGAIVIATNFGTGGNANFWVQDANAASQLYLGFENPVDTTVKVGDAVSFTVTEVGDYSGHPQIQAVEGFTVDSSGNNVPYADRTGMDLTEDDYNRLVRIGGTITDPVLCDSDDAEMPFMCYTMTHGDKTIEYRSNSEFLEDGDCITYFGPVGGFPGPNNDSDTVPEWNLNVINFSWSFTQFD